MSSSTNSMLTEAIAAARTGDRGRARDLLTRLLKADSGKAEYWIWMSSVVDSKRERIYCLESALKLDPTNRSALRGLVILGARKAEKAEIAAASKIKRKQVAAVAKTPTRSLGLNLNIRWFAFVGAAIALLVVIGAGAAVLRRPAVFVSAPTLPPSSVTVTPSPVLPTATLTPIPVETRILRTPIPAELAATPISFFIPETPTATPIWGATPNTSYEAYRNGLRALENSDYERLLTSMEQVIDLDDTLPDAHYFRGEALRNLERPREAIRAYDRAIILDPNFAPAYLGRGSATLDVIFLEEGEIRPLDLPEDYDRAIDADPFFIPAYEAKSAFYSRYRSWNTMEEMLLNAIEDGVNSPIMYILLSRAQFEGLKFEDALESAIEGSAQDPNNLDGYLALGRAHVEVEEFGSALWPLNTYVAYRPEDFDGWGFMARALYGEGQFDEAFEAAEISLSFNDRHAPAYLVRGLVKIEREQYVEAYEDFLEARRYGPENYVLLYGMGRSLYHQGQFVEALNTINPAIEDAPTQQKKAIGYSIRALIYEETNPPLTEDAIRNWQWILSIPDIDPALFELAKTRLEGLGGEFATLTPTLTQTRTPAPTRTSNP